MRTDLTQRCEPCRLRFDRAARSCPRCGGPLSSTKPESSAEVERGPSFATRWSREWEVYAFPTLWLVALVATGLYIAIATHEHPQWGGFIWPFVWAATFGPTASVIPVILLALALDYFIKLSVVDRTLTAAMRWLSRVCAQRRFGTAGADVPPKLQLAPVTARFDAAQTVLRGRTRVTTPIVSPLEAISCIAFRLVGETPAGAVDDAQLAPFEVFADGEWVPVSGEAIVDVDAEPPKRVRSASKALADFLRERGVWGRGTLQLAEGVVRPGEVLEVSGAARYEPLTAQGYRDATLRLTELSGTSARPLVIRRLESSKTD